MRSKKSKRCIALMVWIVLLMAMPAIIEIYYKPLYYAVGVSLTIISIYRIARDEQFEDKFYYRWQTAREQGFWVNVFREGLRAFVIMAVMVSLSQLFGNGLTPLEIVSRLSGTVLAWILLLLTAFGLVVGIVAWHENDNRYYQIHYRKKY